MNISSVLKISLLLTYSSMCFSSATDATDGVSIWTEHIPSNDTRIVYISDSLGNDSQCASYLASDMSNPFNPPASSVPCKTISAAKNIYDDLPDNEPHWVLFKSGDTWTDQVFGKWEKSGRSASEPALMASYGDSTERPKILTGEASFSSAIENGAKYVTIADIYVRAHTYQTPDGLSGPRAFRWITSEPGGDWVFEGIHIEDFQTSFLIGASGNQWRGMITNFTFRNSIVNGNKGENALYVTGVNGLKIFENNFFYENGYYDDALTGGTPRAKHIYFDNENGYPPGDPSGHAIFRNNLFVNSAALCFQARTGGEIYNNYIEEEGFGIGVGSHDTGQTWPIVSASIHDNVILHLSDSVSQSLGYGMVVENSDSNIANNIIAYYESEQDFGHPFYISGNGGNAAIAQIINNTIYDTVGDIRKSDDIESITLTDNMVNEDMDLTPSNVRSDSVNFTDPGRDMATYNQDILGGSLNRDEFIIEALKQWRGFYRLEYTAPHVNDYVREGYKPDGSQPEVCSKGAVPCTFGESPIFADGFE